MTRDTSTTSVRDRIRYLPMTLSVALAAACGVDTLSPPNTGSGITSVETVDVRRRLFELDQSVPVVLEALVAGVEGAEGVVFLPVRLPAGLDRARVVRVLHGS